MLVIFGGLDAIVPLEQAKLFERVPGAKIATIEGAGHSPMVEAPLKTLKLIEDFMKKSGDSPESPPRISERLLFQS